MELLVGLLLAVLVDHLLVMGRRARAIPGWMAATLALAAAMPARSTVPQWQTAGMSASSG